MTISTSYLQHVFYHDTFQRTVDKTVTMAERLKKETLFDTIVFSGISGSALAFILSHWMNMPLLCVRKLGENSHYHNQTKRVLEGNVENMRRYLIVDDFISSGDTCRRIVESIRDTNPRAKCVAMLMYAAYQDSEFKHPDWDYSVRVYSSKPADT